MEVSSLPISLPCHTAAVFGLRIGLSAPTGHLQVRFLVYIISMIVYLLLLQGRSTFWKASTTNRPISILFTPRKAAKLGRISTKRAHCQTSSTTSARAAEMITVVVASSTPTPRPTDMSSTCLLVESLPTCGIALGSEYGASSDLPFLQISQRRSLILLPGVLLPPSSRPPTVILLLISLNTLSC